MRPETVSNHHTQRLQRVAGSTAICHSPFAWQTQTRNPNRNSLCFLDGTVITADPCSGMCMEQKQRQHLAGGVPARVCTWMCTSLASGSRRVKTCGCRWPFLSGAAMPMARVPLGCSFTCQTGSSMVQHLSPCHAVQVCSIHQGYQCKPTVKVVPCKNSEQGVAFFPCNAAGLHLLHALELLAGRRLESSHHLVPCNLACMSTAQPGSAGRRADSIACRRCSA